MTTHQTCTDLEAAMSAYVDHEASPQELAAVEHHVQSCPDCARRLRRYAQLATRLDTHIQGVVVAPARATAASALPARHPGRWLGLAAIVALMLLIAGSVFIALFRSMRDDPGIPPSADEAAGTVLVARLDGIVDPAEAAYVQRVLSLAQADHAPAVVLTLQVAGGLDAAVDVIQQAESASPIPVITYLPAGAVHPAAVRLAGASGLRAAAPGLAANAELSAPDLAFALREADGRTVHTASGETALSTAATRAEVVQMEPLEALGHRLLDPTTAYLLFVLGLFAVLLEVSHPGALVPGVTGLISLICSVTAFVVLGANAFGIALMVIAVGLMAVDVRAFGHGSMTLVGIGCLVAGSLLLYTFWGGTAPLMADVAIDPLALVSVVASGLLLGLGLVRVAAGVRKLPPLVSVEDVVGARGVARGALEPDGVIQVNGQLWSARLVSGRIGAGEPVRVRARRGLILEVEPATSTGAATHKGAWR